MAMLIGSLPTNIINCSNSGRISAYDEYAGGIVGVMYGNIQACFNSGIITGNKWAGGIVGVNISIVEIINCYNTGNVSATTINAGGIIGACHNAFPSSLSIRNSYNIGKISSPSYVGAIIGNDITPIKVISNNYWTSSSGCSYGIGSGKNTGATPVSTLKGYATILDESNWIEAENSEYPILKWQNSND